MNIQPVEILDDLTLITHAGVVARLQPSQALEMAEALVRKGMRRILFEEGADALRADEPTVAGSAR